jgi:hypothetical protein
MLSRTVLVSTKFDTRIPQFSAAADVEAFMHPGTAQLMHTDMLGGSPFFTSVPSGRVGTNDDAVFRTCAPALSQPALRSLPQGPRCPTPFTLSAQGITTTCRRTDKLAAHSFSAHCVPWT